MAKKPVTKKRALDAGIAPLISMELQGLFGKYNFPLISLFGASEDAENAAFLYGENGVGKTTILRLIFLILAYPDSSGYRSELAKQIFLSVKLNFRSGNYVRVFREAARDGGYKYQILIDKDLSEFDVVVNSDNDVPDSANKNDLVESIRRLGLDVIFLTDNRAIRSTFDLSGKPEEVSSLKTSDYILYSTNFMRKSLSANSDAEIPSTSILKVIESANASLVSRSIVAGSVGEQEAAQVYLDVVKAIVAATGEPSSELSIRRDEMIVEMENIEKKLTEYRKFELVSDLRMADVRKIVLRVQLPLAAQLLGVLDPYIRSTRERLEALGPVLRSMKVLEDNLNGFLKRKRVKVSRSGGIQFFDFDDTPLSPTKLSSGERHLIFLFCVSLISSDRRMLILVDEPELSLNFKWQRRLVPNLLELSRSNNTQYVFATHAAEIMSLYESSVQRLSPKLMVAKSRG